MGKIRVIVGGQFGSESKGAVTGWLARELKGRTHEVTVVRVAGPNAGHSAYDDLGRLWALRQIPVAAVTNLGANLVIAAGSEIDPPVLFDEIERLQDAGIPILERLWVDDQATVIDDSHKDGETSAALVSRIGSTGKGIGAARAARLMRTATTWGQFVRDHHGMPEIITADTGDLLSAFAAMGDEILIEGTQGYGLGLHAGHYPQVTSSDCRAIDFMAMAGVSPWQMGVEDLEVWVTARMFPIRVAGNSGPLNGETTWEDLGLKPELTTVTKKVRRVGAWDPDLLRDAVIANGGGAHTERVRVALAMVDQKWPALAGLHGEFLSGGAVERQIASRNDMDAAAVRQAMFELADFTAEIERTTGAQVMYMGTGPDTRLWTPGAVT